MASIEVAVDMKRFSVLRSAVVVFKKCCLGIAILAVEIAVEAVEVAVEDFAVVAEAARDSEPEEKKRNKFGKEVAERRKAVRKVENFIFLSLI